MTQESNKPEWMVYRDAANEINEMVVVEKLRTEFIDIAKDALRYAGIEGCD